MAAETSPRLGMDWFHIDCWGIRAGFNAKNWCISNRSIEYSYLSKIFQSFSTLKINHSFFPHVSTDWIGNCYCVVSPCWYLGLFVVGNPMKIPGNPEELGRREMLEHLQRKMDLERLRKTAKGPWVTHTFFETFFFLMGGLDVISWMFLAIL